MSIYVKCWFALAIFFLIGDALLLILGATNMRFGLSGVLCAAVGSIHSALDRIDVLAQCIRALNHAQLSAVERPTDAIKGRR